MIPIIKTEDAKKVPMRLWAIQYAVNVEILAPRELVEKVRQDLRMAAEKYDVS